MPMVRYFITLLCPKSDIVTFGHITRFCYLLTAIVGIITTNVTFQYFTSTNFSLTTTAHRKRLYFYRYRDTHVGGGSPDATHGISTRSLTRYATSWFASETIIGGTATIDRSADNVKQQPINDKQHKKHNKYCKQPATRAKFGFNPQSTALTFQVPLHSEVSFQQILLQTSAKFKFVCHNS